MYPIDAISIHTPLAGSDGTSLRAALLQQISIHTPLAGSDLVVSAPDSGLMVFQSTLPLRGATVSSLPPFELVQFQSTLPLRGATIPQSCLPQISLIFQSTLPLRGATHPLTHGRFDPEFQSTLPLRGATFKRSVILLHERHISIHTPLAGSDGRPLWCVCNMFSYFNPHSPCGERRVPQPTRPLRSYFNPHSPCGERPQK